MGVYAIRRDYTRSTIHKSYDRAWRSMNRKIHDRCIRYFETRQEAEYYIHTGRGFGNRRVPPIIESEVVYTDGCCYYNGQPGAYAGWGIWYGDDDWRNDCGPVPQYEPQTSQYAELMAKSKALERALEVAEELGIHTKIYTDSKYVQHCLTDWGDTWDRRGYYTRTGKPVSHASLIQYCRELLSDADAELYEWWPDEDGTCIDVEYVPSHSGHVGNEEADELAREGAEMPW